MNDMGFIFILFSIALSACGYSKVISDKKITWILTQ